ncbi:MAG: tubulin-like doman-containing protein [Herbinix sp.]|nr:tubulin-like doman-containing protein [Herbinix sp.]
MLNVGVIGCGNAGNQVAKLVSSEGISALVINSSESDLQGVNNVKYQFLIGEEKRGAGKDRSNAKKYLKETAKEILDHHDFEEFIGVTDVCFVVSSTGGGTGSGVVPVLTEILQHTYPQKTFIVISILPSLKESVAAQQNTIDFLKEIKNSVTEATFMCYDNGTFDDLPTDLMMSKVNSEIANDILAIKGVYQIPTPFNSIDQRDMLKIIGTPGRLVVYRQEGFKEKDIDKKTLEDMFLEKIKTGSANCELENDNIVMKTGVIANLSERINNHFDINMPKVHSYIGEPIENFQHIALLNEETTINRVIFIAAGMSFPDDRILKIMQRISDVMSKFQAKKSSILDSEEFSTDDLRSLRTDTVRASENETSVKLDDLFSRFN